MNALSITTTERHQIVDLTSQVAALAAEYSDGLLHVFIKHTTAALALAALPDKAGQDLIGVLPKLIPSVDFEHAPPEHVPAHILSAIIGASLTVPIRDGLLGVGEFQSIVLLELQGPSQREVEVRFISLGA